jgi:hypothetical protein
MPSSTFVAAMWQAQLATVNGLIQLATAMRPFLTAKQSFLLAPAK